MKSFCILSVLTLLGTCSSPKYTARIQNIKDSIHLVDSTLVIKYSNTITSKELTSHLYKFASPDFEGRKVGEKGQKKAAKFLKSYYENEAIKSPFGGSNYYQTIPGYFFSKFEIKV